MGRKPAPRPLALSEIALPTSEYARPETAHTTQINSRDGSVISSTLSPASPPPMSPPFYTDHNNQPVAQTAQQPPVHIVDLIQSQPDDDASYSYEQQAQPTQQEQQRHQPPPPQQQQQRQQQAAGSQGYGRSRQNEEKHSKSSFFRFGKSSTARSNERLASNNYTTDARNDTMSRGADSSTGGATPKPSDTSYIHPDQHTASNVSGATLSARPETASASAATEADPSALARKGKQKTFTRLGRSRSNRDDENGSPHPLNSANTARATGLQEAPPIRAAEPAGPLKTAPIAQRDRAFRDMMSSSARTHSADRAQQRDIPGQRDGPRGDRDRDHHRMQPSSLRDNSGSTFFNGLRNSSRSAADMISKGLFGKSARSGSTTERETTVDDEHYVLKVINLPLVEQTRLTRISKRLEDSRDKTEFWMPSFPWRAIDYLNYKGTDVEGLYRVPGSGPQIKRWQRKFDEECDVDLFNQEDLYDINIIGSMLKAWLRELPDELFPKDAQERIARECAGAETVPQMLIDELSSLPPYNYYLLFAITCHLSLLLAHSDKNKMDFRNLCICFQPCMKIDAFSFKFLVCDWRDCWKGCLDEPRYIEEEYRLMNAPIPRSIAFQSPQQTGSNTEQERVTVEPPENENDQRRRGSNDEEEATASKTEEHHSASSDSSKQSDQNADSSKVHVKRKNNITAETGSVASNSTLSTTLTIDSQQRVTTPPGQSGDLRPLSPIKPLSPLGF